jgi:pimeloyl-ACP methyl ester carboxylesterase
MNKPIPFLVLIFFFGFYCGRENASDSHSIPEMNEVAAFAGEVDQPDSAKDKAIIVPEITYADIPYGPHPRNVLDFWKAESPQPTPVVVFIHGGGFKRGDKRLVLKKGRVRDIVQCLNHGISFASINYRFRQTTRLDSILYDCARAIQLLRYKSGEWNIDKSKIAAYGNSAGGGIALWLGVYDDLADPENSDPVLCESSRISAVGHIKSQATYDFDKWDGILALAENWHASYQMTHDLELYEISSQSQYHDDDIIQLRRLVNMPAYIDSGDPPIFISNIKDPQNLSSLGDILHHPNHAIFLKKKYDAVGIPSVLILRSTPDEEKISVIDFFIDVFE